MEFPLSRLPLKESRFNKPVEPIFIEFIKSILWLGLLQSKASNRLFSGSLLVTVALVISIQPTWDNQWRLTDFAINPTVSLDELKRLAAVLPLEIDPHVSSIMIHLAKSGVDKGIAVEFCMNQA